MRSGNFGIGSLIAGSRFAHRALCTEDNDDIERVIIISERACCSPDDGWWLLFFPSFWFLGCNRTESGNETRIQRVKTLKSDYSQLDSLLETIRIFFRISFAFILTTQIFVADAVVLLLFVVGYD